MLESLRQPAVGEQRDMNAGVQLTVSPVRMGSHSSAELFKDLLTDTLEVCLLGDSKYR